MAKIYLVTRNGGSWEDKYTINLRCYHDKDRALRRVVRLEKVKSAKLKRVDLLLKHVEDHCYLDYVCETCQQYYDLRDYELEDESFGIEELELQ